ncbi:GntR family transcriptional regulator [Neobacillus dielmonensis]|uniref:GntR family transcriptional regulator n=1 Tax=Neobacillus dielmonensis TaxID=1347369 RepID=UPI0005A677EE|nr:GntR family transcriptional regulator [Neobacillus dielmonensis]
MVILDSESNVPLYLQLRTQIIESIVRGELAKGDTLPSVRALAGDLGINMHTVNKSYHELESKGIIKIVPKKGAVIIADAKKHALKQQYENLVEDLRPVVAEGLVYGLSEADFQQLISSIISKIKEESS